MRKFNNFTSIFIRYFLLTGCVSNIIFAYYPPLGVAWFLWWFLSFIDDDFEDPEQPNEIDLIGQNIEFV